MTGGGVSTAVVAELAGVSVQAVRLACREGNLAAKRRPSGEWVVDCEAAVRYAVERLGSATAIISASGAVALTLAPGQVHDMFLALNRAVRSTRHSRSQCPACRQGRCAEHPDRAAEIASFHALQRHLRSCSS